MIPTDRLSCFKSNSFFSIALRSLTSSRQLQRTYIELTVKSILRVSRQAPVHAENPALLFAEGAQLQTRAVETVEEIELLQYKPMHKIHKIAINLKIH